MQNRDKAINAAIRNKLKVLREFKIVTDENKEDVINQFMEAVEAEPYKSPLVIIDRVANKMISTKLETLPEYFLKIRA